jgi:ArsR family transcriptional regulator
MELSVGEIAQVLGQSQPRVSRHVKILIDAGLAERRKEGSWVFVSLGGRARLEPLFQLLDRWSELDGDNPATAADAARLAAVRADRAAAAERALLQRAAVTAELRHHGVEVVDAEPQELPPQLADMYIRLKAAGRL